MKEYQVLLRTMDHGLPRIKADSFFLEASDEYLAYWFVNDPNGQGEQIVASFPADAVAGIIESESRA